MLHTPPTMPGASAFFCCSNTQAFTQLCSAAGGQQAQVGRQDGVRAQGVCVCADVRRMQGAGCVQGAGRVHGLCRCACR